MLLEDILLAVAVGIVALTVGVPIVRLLMAAPWRREDPLAAAQERLRVAKIEAEIAKVNREADSIYDSLYEEALAEDREGGDARVAKRENATATLEGAARKGERHGQE
jgi:hypothetical protein